MPSWVYIAGRGYSGSTTLDALLGNACTVESVGELVSGMGRYDGFCSCGERFKDCPFWSGVRRRFEQGAGISWEEAVHETQRQAHLQSFPGTLLTSYRHAQTKKLVQICKNLAAAIATESGDNPKVIVDSSKEITRALFLMRFVPETRIIHLVKHPETVLQSYYYRLKKGRQFKLLRRRFTPGKFLAPFLFMGAVNWTIGNILVEIVRLFGKKRFLRIRYEDLLESPIEEVEKIERFIGVSLSDLNQEIAEQQVLKIGHNIGGNHMRMAKEFVLDPDRARREELPRLYKLMANFCCFPLLLVYGYYFRPSTPNR